MNGTVNIIECEKNADCDDSVDCTVDTCNLQTGRCEYAPDDSLCDDGLFCNGGETCDAELGCQPGVPIDCSLFNIPGISTCFNSPDDNPFTFDFRPAFTSTCDEETDSCTIGDESISHECSIEECGSECESVLDCPEKCTEVSHKLYTNVECSDCQCEYFNYKCVIGKCGAECDSDDDCSCPQDKCVDADGDGFLDDYADYPDYGRCGTSGEEGCLCQISTEEGGDCEATIIYDDGVHCGECKSDADCDDGLFCNGQETCVDGFCQAGQAVDCSYLDDQCNVGFCDEENDKCIKDSEPKEGQACDDNLFCTINDICSNGVCVGEQRGCDDSISCTLDFCNEDLDTCEHDPQDSLCDDGLFCNGGETCDAELGCQPGVPIDCSLFNIPGIATCTNDPDNNPFTFDFRLAFTSTCDEETDSCTIGDESITHVCSIEECNAECEVKEDCGDDGLAGEPYCSNNDLYQDNRSYSCDDCECNYENVQVLIEDCGESYCENWGENYCKNDDVYHSRTCHSIGCSDLDGASCFDNVYIDEELVEECAYGCDKGICNIRINIPSGQSIFSLPREVEEKSFDKFYTNCELKDLNICSKPFAYYEPTDDLDISNYVCLDVNDTLYPGQGYFINVQNDCYIVFKGGLFGQEKIGYLGTGKLKTGWNLMGATSQKELFNQGTCNLYNRIGAIKYVYGVNTCKGVENYNGKYEDCREEYGVWRCGCSVDVLEPGLGYWIRTKNDCSLI